MSGVRKTLLMLIVGMVLNHVKMKTLNPVVVYQIFLSKNFASDFRTHISGCI